MPLLSLLLLYRLLNEVKEYYNLVAMYVTDGIKQQFCFTNLSLSEIEKYMHFIRKILSF